MPRRGCEEVTWNAPPSDWDERPTWTFVPAGTSDGLEGPVIKLWCVPLGPGDTIRRLADRKLQDPAHEFPELKVVDLDGSETLTVGGRSALRLGFLFGTKQRPLVKTRERLVVQTIVWIDAPEGPARQALVVVGTAPIAETLAMQAAFAGVLESLRFA